jgi:hypothetical protein
MTLGRRSEIHSRYAPNTGISGKSNTGTLGKKRTSSCVQLLHCRHCLTSLQPRDCVQQNHYSAQYPWKNRWQGAWRAQKLPVTYYCTIGEKVGSLACPTLARILIVFTWFAIQMLTRGNRKLFHVCCNSSTCFRPVLLWGPIRHQSSG